MTLTASVGLVSARGVVLRRRARTVLAGLDLDVAPGQCLAISGRSGSGKTSLLLILAGLLEPSEGVVQRAVGPLTVYVPQGPSLVPELSALDNAALPLRLRGTPPAESLARARGALELLGLADAQYGLPWQLSVGMQQRVALARALALRPALLLTDEPTGSLDQASGRHVLDVLLQQSGTDGSALVVATHDPDVTRRFGERLILQDGRLEVLA